MFDGILINPRTGARLENYLAAPGQALLLCGPAGSGKKKIARVVAARLLEIPPEKVDEHAYFLVYGLPPDKKEIPIDSARDIIKKLRLQVPGSKNIRRIVLIEDAHLLSQEAQNALLKALEEPAPATVFIMTAISKNGLLATISSRMAAVSVDPVDLGTARQYFNQNDKEVQSAWALSQGAAGLLEEILSGEGSELKEGVDRAKNLLTKTPYERLLELDSIKDKAELARALDGLARVIRALTRASASRGDANRTKKLTSALQVVIDAQTGLAANVLPRLVVLKLILSLPL